MTKITYFDFCDLGYSSLYVAGFLELASEGRLKFVVSRTAPEALKDVEDEMRTQWFWRRGTRSEYAVFRYQNGDDFLFCVDLTDLNGETDRGGFQPLLLERCKYYFKVNYNEEAIAANPVAAPYAEKILPVPLTFRIQVPQPWRFLPEVIGLSSPRWPTDMVKGRMRRLFGSPTIAQYRQMRQLEEDIDVYFPVFLYPIDWNPQFGEMNVRRMALIDELSQLKDRDIITGYVYFSGSHHDFEDYAPKQYQSKYEKYHVPRVHQKTHVNHTARSRIGLYQRGTDDCTSFKFGEILALGKAIVGETLRNNNDQLYAYPRFNEQFAYDDAQELVAQIDYLLSNPDELEELRRLNANTFDTMLTPKPVVTEILEQLEV